MERQEIEVIIRGKEGVGKADLAAFLQKYFEMSLIEVDQCDTDAAQRMMNGMYEHTYLRRELRHHKITIRTEHTGVAEWLQNKREKEAA